MRPVTPALARDEWDREGVPERDRLVRRRHHDPADRPMRRTGPLEPCHRVDVEAVDRFVQQPDRRTARNHARKRRALALPGRQHAHRHRRKMRDPHRIERVRQAGAAVQSRPEAQRAFQGQLSVKGDILIRQGDGASPRDAAGRRLQQSCGEPDQARLAGAVRAGDECRLAGLQREADALEQQPATPNAGHILEAQRRHPAASSSACMSASDRPK
jgi:hypothetical protein